MKAEIKPCDTEPVITYEPLNADGSVADGQEPQVLQMDLPGAHTKPVKPQDIHLIIDGKSFAVVKEHCSDDLMNKVPCCYGNTPKLLTVFPLAPGQGNSLCQDVT